MWAKWNLAQEQFFSTECASWRPLWLVWSIYSNLGFLWAVSTRNMWSQSPLKWHNIKLDVDSLNIMWGNNCWKRNISSSASRGRTDSQLSSEYSYVTNLWVRCATYVCIKLAIGPQLLLATEKLHKNQDNKMIRNIWFTPVNCKWFGTDACYSCAYSCRRWYRHYLRCFIL